MKRDVLNRLGLSVLSAVMLFLAVPTFGLWPLMWVALVPHSRWPSPPSTHKRAFLYGWLTGIVAHAVAFSWMNGSSSSSGTCHPSNRSRSSALLVGYQGLAFALFAWGVRRARLRTGLPLACWRRCDGRDRARDAADVSLLPGLLAGVRAGASSRSPT